MEVLQAENRRSKRKVRNPQGFQWGISRVLDQKQRGPGLVKKKEEKTKSREAFAFPDRITRAESHALDATRHLDTLQYPVRNLSRLQMIHGSSNLALLCAPRECVWSWPEGYRNFNR